MKIHDRARFFDPRLWNNNDAANNDIFYVPATVIKVYRHEDNGRELVDLKFDHRPYEISKGHYTDLVIKETGDRFVQACEVQKGDCVNIGGLWMSVTDNFPVNDGVVGIAYLFRYSGLAGHLIAPNALLILKKED